MKTPVAEAVVTTTPYNPSISAITTRERWSQFWKSGADLRLIGSGCYVGALGLASWGAVEGPKMLDLFGVRIVEPKATIAWAGLLALWLTVGYGFTFQQEWVWDMTLTTIGFLAASHVMNGVVWGLTLAGIGALFALGLGSVYLIWRRGTLVPVVPVVQRGRRR